MTDSWNIHENASTKTLVELYQSEHSTIPEREQAFIILTYRFRKEVLQKCEILCKRYGQDFNTAEVVAYKTFDSYARKGKFDERKGRGKSYDESFLLYLLKIAEHELINYYREIERKKNNPYDGSEQILCELPPYPLQNLPMETIIEYNVIKTFSKAHRTIYLTYRTYQRPGFKLPRKLLETLRNVLGGISQNTVNVYLKEAKDEVKKAIEMYHLTKNFKKDERGTK